MRALRFFLVACAFSIATAAQAGNWPQWRGPNFNGSTDEKNLPAKFSPTENVKWAVDLPGPSASTPITWEDKVFVSSTDVKAQTLNAICIDRKTGKVLWRHAVGKGLEQRRSRSNYASPSPATDGKVVVFFYGNGHMVTFDLNGKKLWSENFGPFAFGWTFSSSPLLHNGKLYLQILQRDVKVDGKGPDGDNIESYLLALDPQTGKRIWKQPRPSKAKMESREAFTSPIIAELNGKKQLVVVGGDALTGHDPESGKELWRWGTWNPERERAWRLVPSPVTNGDVVLACAPKRQPIYAVKTGGKGVLTDDALAWVSREDKSITSDVPTPGYYDGDFFILSDVRKNLSRVDPKTGKVKWSVITPGRAKYEGSPLCADGKIYLINFDGVVVVISAEDGKLLHRVAMQPKPEQSPVRSSVVAAHGQLFIRTNGKLYCVGN